MTHASPWWAHHRHQDRRTILTVRNRIRDAVRRWFTQQGFTEVDPGIVQLSPGNETHLHGFATTAIDTSDKHHTAYLNTSPEFAMKKLLAAGETQIFALQPVFRNREHGPLHAPEFTMLEWYRTHADQHAMMDDCEALLRLAAEAAGAAHLTHRHRSAAVPEGRFLRMTVAHRMAAAVGCPKHRMEELIAVEARDDLARAMRAAGHRVGDDDDWSTLLSRLLVIAEHRLAADPANDTPAFLVDYPRSEAALAAHDPERPWLAQRFELFACGIELANGFTELTDADEQRRRFYADEDERERLYGERLPIDEEFLSALKHMPPAAGCALGFDRLVMLATGAPHVDQVRWTPWPITTQ